MWRGVLGLQGHFPDCQLGGLLVDWRMNQTRVSGARWTAPAATVLLVLAMLWPFGSSEEGGAPWWLPELFDACHMPSLLVMGWLWGRWRPPGVERGRLPQWRLFWIGLVAAVALEPLQHLTGRHMDAVDALANASGWSLGLWLTNCRSGRGRAAVAGLAGVVAAGFAWPLGQHWQDRQLWRSSLPAAPHSGELRQLDRWWKGYGRAGAEWRVELVGEDPGWLRVTTAGGDFSGVRLRLGSLPDEWLGSSGGLAFEIRSESGRELTVRLDASRGGEALRGYASVSAGPEWRPVTVVPDGWTEGGATIRQVSWFRGPGEPDVVFEVRAVRFQ